MAIVLLQMQLCDRVAFSIPWQLTRPVKYVFQEHSMSVVMSSGDWHSINLNSWTIVVSFELQFVVYFFYELHL